MQPLSQAQVMKNVEEYNEYFNTNKKMDKKNIKLGDLEKFISQNPEILQECMIDIKNKKIFLNLADNIESVFTDNKGSQVAASVRSLANQTIAKKYELPKEIIGEVISHLKFKDLKAMSLVSKLWYDSARSVKDQRVIYSKIPDKYKFEDAINIIQIKLLKYVDLTSNDLQLDDERVSTFLKSLNNECSSLQGINLSFRGGDRSYYIPTVTENVKSLVELGAKLQGLYIDSTMFENEHLKQIAEKCTSLKIIKIQNESYIKEEGLKYFAETCHTLQKIMLPKQAPKHSMESFRGVKLSAEVFNVFLNNSPDLQFIDLTGREVKEISKGIGEKCPNLQGLLLRGCNLDDSQLRDFGKCPNLEMIDISDREITDSGFKDFIDNCPNLNAVSIIDTKITISGIKHLLDSNPNAKIYLREKMADSNYGQITPEETSYIKEKYPNVTLQFPPESFPF